MEKMTEQEGGVNYSRLDPRVSVLVFLTVAASSIFLPGRTAPGKLFLFAVLLLGLNFIINRQPPRVLKKTACLFLFLPGLIIFLVPVTLIFSNRQPVENLKHLSLLILRTAVILTADGILILSQKQEDLASALIQSGLPRTATQLLASALRYYLILKSEAVSSFRARTSREFQKRPRVESWKITGFILERIFQRLIERSQRIYAAMISRGFQGRLYGLREYRIRALDRLVILLTIGGQIFLWLI